MEGRTLRRIAISLGILVAAFYLGMVFFMWWTQESLVFQPTAGNVVFPDSGLNHEVVTIDVAPGVRIQGWFVYAPAEAIGTVLYFHGNAGNLETSFSHLRKFADEGFDTFAIDYEGYGGSDGRPSEENVYRDADAAWDWLTRTRGILPEQVIVWGHSLGGAAATWCGLKNKARLVVLDNTFTSIPDMGTRLYPWLPVKWISRVEFSNLDRVAAIRSPILIANARDDELVPFDMGQALFDAANPPKRFVELQGGHSYGFDETAEAWLALKAFLAELN